MLIEPDTRVIPLSQGQFALVDAEDFPELSKYKWHAHFAPATGTFYAKRGEYLGNYKTIGIWMHRQIMGVPKGDPQQIDHKDRTATLDNRKRNLRFATRAQQVCNQRLRSTNTSGFKGVSKIGNSYRATIKMNGKWKHLGCRPTAEQAYRELFVPAAKELQGEFAGI